MLVFLADLLMHLRVLALVAPRNSFPELFSASIMITLTILNLALSGWESQRRSVEIFRRAENMTNLVKGALDSPDWLPAHFPHSLTPDSPLGPGGSAQAGTCATHWAPPPIARVL